MDTLQTLVDFSRKLGSDPALVQGGGGNTSLKEGGHMWIKASGTLLCDVTPTKGFVAVDHTAIHNALTQARDEDSYTALVMSHIIEKEGIPSARPSLETGFHALLGQAVLHSHSVWANLLACDSQGEVRVKNLFPEVLWVPYATPGLPLMKNIANVIKTQEDNNLCLLLQNHGLIVSAPSLAQAQAKHAAIDETIRAAFHLNKTAFADQKDNLPADRDHILFPDQAVYLTQQDLATSPAGKQTLQAYSFIRSSLEKAGRNLHYLSHANVDFLLNMESEKFRQKCARA